MVLTRRLKIGNGTVTKVITVLSKLAPSSIHSLSLIRVRWLVLANQTSGSLTNQIQKQWLLLQSLWKIVKDTKFPISTAVSHKIEVFTILISDIPIVYGSHITSPLQKSSISKKTKLNKNLGKQVSWATFIGYQWKFQNIYNKITKGKRPGRQYLCHFSAQTMSTRIVKLFYYCRLLAQTSLRNILGTKNLHEILSDRESISIAMQVLYTNKYCRLIIWYFQFLTIILFLFLQGNPWWGHNCLGYKSGKSGNVRPLSLSQTIKHNWQIFTNHINFMPILARMLDFQNNYKGQWRRRQRLRGRPELR